MNTPSFLGISYICCKLTVTLIGNSGYNCISLTDGRILEIYHAGLLNCPVLLLVGGQRFIAEDACDDVVLEEFEEEAWDPELVWLPDEFVAEFVGQILLVDPPQKKVMKFARLQWGQL